MDNKQGEELLSAQKDKIASLNDQTYRTWESHTAWIFEQLFTKESDLYKSISQFEFYNYHSDTSTNHQIRQNAPRAINLIESAIEMVKHRPVPEAPPKLNIIYRIKDNWLIFWASTIFAAYGGVFYLGTLYGKYDERLSKPDNTETNKVSTKDTAKINSADSINYDKIPHN